MKDRGMYRIEVVGWIPIYGDVDVSAVSDDTAVRTTRTIDPYDVNWHSIPDRGDIPGLVRRVRANDHIFERPS